MTDFVLRTLGKLGAITVPTVVVTLLSQNPEQQICLCQWVMGMHYISTYWLLWYLGILADTQSGLRGGHPAFPETDITKEWLMERVMFTLF